MSAAPSRPDGRADEPPDDLLDRDCGKRVDNWWNTGADVAERKKKSTGRAPRCGAFRLWTNFDSLFA
jgi:hypothetical protein